MRSTYGRLFNKNWLLAVVTILTLTGCSIEDNPAVVVVTDDKPFDNDRYIDNTVRPGDDFYRYAYGKWLDDSNLLEPSVVTDKAFTAFETEMYEKTDDPVATVLRKLTDDAIADGTADIALIKERLEMLAGIDTQDKLLEAFKQLHQLGYMPGCAWS